MPLPADLTPINVTGTFPDAAGGAESGSVTFTPSADLTDPAGRVIIRATACSTPVVHGVMVPIQLACTDNGNLSPTGWTYLVTEAIGGQVRSYSVLLPHTLGANVDLSALSPVVPQTPVTNVITSSAPMAVSGAAANGQVLTATGGSSATWQAASGGGSATLSRQILIDLSAQQHSTVTATVGTWGPHYYMDTDTGGLFQGWVGQDDPASQNDSASFDFAAGAGTYSLELLHLVSSNRGIYTIQIDGVTAGTIDGYASAFAYTRSLLTGITISAGQHVLTLLMATKNASSSGYDALVERAILTRTA